MEELLALDYSENINKDMLLLLLLQTGISESGYLDVLFVDYGNIGCVHMDCVYKLPPDILKIRKQVMIITLACLVHCHIFVGSSRPSAPSMSSGWGYSLE